MITTRVEHDSGAYVEVDDLELRLQDEPEDEVLIQKVEGKGYVVGYLTTDPDCENPLDSCDGEGHVYSAHRHSSTHAEMQAALGLDNEWKKTGKRNPLAVPLDCYQHSGTVWAVAGTRSFPDDQWDVAHGGGVWVPDSSCEEHINSVYLLQLLPKGSVHVNFRGSRAFIDIKVGTDLGAAPFPTADTPDPEWKTINPKGFKHFQSAIQALVKYLGVKPSKEDRERMRYAEAVVQAESALELYNAWLAGDCHYIICESFDLKGVSLCDAENIGGFVGSKHALDQLKETLEYTAQAMKNEPAS
jgi:hypothetical protein